jgi:hypothetical protein
MINIEALLENVDWTDVFTRGKTCVETKGYPPTLINRDTDRGVLYSFTNADISIKMVYVRFKTGKEILGVLDESTSVMMFKLTLENNEVSFSMTTADDMKDTVLLYINAVFTEIGYIKTSAEGVV